MKLHTLPLDKQSISKDMSLIISETRKLHFHILNMKDTKQDSHWILCCRGKEVISGWKSNMAKNMLFCVSNETFWWIKSGLN